MVTRGSPKPLLRVRVLLPLPNKNDPALVGSFLFSFKGKKDLNGAGVNDVPVARSRRPDRRVSSEEKESFCQKSGIFRAALFSYNQCSPQPGPGNLAFPAACSVGEHSYASVCPFLCIAPRARQPLGRITPQIPPGNARRRRWSPGRGPARGRPSRRAG